jgi:hypothetical protein
MLILLVSRRNEISVGSARALKMSNKLFVFTVLVLGGARLTYALPEPQVIRYEGRGVVISVNGETALLHTGEHLGKWTLMQMIKGTPPQKGEFAVLEDVTELNGDLVFVDRRGIAVRLGKSAEPTSSEASAPPYLGHSVDEVMKSPTDLLGDSLLANGADPRYAQVASALPPIHKMLTYGFVGTEQTFDKLGLDYGGRSPNFDPAIYFGSVLKVRAKSEVLGGLLGGYLPVLRFVYPEAKDSWVEMLVFAPPRVFSENNRIQPVWYRVTHVESGVLTQVKYVDTYEPYPPRAEVDSTNFYSDLLQLHSYWDNALSSAMKIDVPDARFTNMSRFSLIQEMMTRIGDYPKYGVLDRNYGGSEHDGFPDTFTVDTSAMLEWGMIDQAGRYIRNYFNQFVRDDGSLLYRGPETGQYGRMLTVLAQYVNDGGDPRLILQLRTRIDGVTKLLLALRENAKRLPSTSPAYGMIAGWSEADACLDPDPKRYIQPYFSNSTEAARGFRDLGLVWQKFGTDTHNAALAEWGRELQRQAAALETDIQASISKSILHVQGETILPAIAGVSEPFHVAVVKDKDDPQFRSYRAYMEMLYSGTLTEDQVKMVIDYRSKHHDILVGMPTAYGYNTGEIAGFLAYGNGYALIQHDLISKALLLTYSDMAHQYTRGTWTAPETRNIQPDRGAAPYCAPAQMVVALMTKWLLVFEEPGRDVLWLAKGTPRDWLEDSKTIAVEGATTRWGKVGYSIKSQIQSGQVSARVKLPAHFAATAKLRLRVPIGYTLESVTIDGRSWSNFDKLRATIDLPVRPQSELNVTASFKRIK